MRLYNTLTRRLDEVVPIEEGHVTMYTCGPTVYRYAHLGNLRSQMLADLIRRALVFEGFRVTQIMNITDVGHMTDEASPEAVDKMLLAVEDEGLSPLEIAEKYTAAVFEEAEAVGIAPADRYPKATDHIQEMIDLTQVLIERGHAYVVDSGSVYYDVTSFPGYGKLSGQHAGQAPGGPSRPGDRPGQAQRRRLRAVEGRGCRAAHEVGLPVGRRLPGLAHRVLGDVHEVPG